MIYALIVRPTVLDIYICDIISLRDIGISQPGADVGPFSFHPVLKITILLGTGLHHLASSTDGSALYAISLVSLFIIEYKYPFKAGCHSLCDPL